METLDYDNIFDFNPYPINLPPSPYANIDDFLDSREVRALMTDVSELNTKKWRVGDLLPIAWRFGLELFRCCLTITGERQSEWGKRGDDWMRLQERGWRHFSQYSRKIIKDENWKRLPEAEGGDWTFLTIDHKKIVLTVEPYDGLPQAGHTIRYSVDKQVRRTEQKERHKR